MYYESIMKLEEVIVKKEIKKMIAKDDLIAQQKYLKFYNEIKEYLKNNEKETDIIKVLKYFKVAINKNVEYEKEIKKENGESLTDIDMLTHHHFLNDIKFVVELKFRNGVLMSPKATTQIRNIVNYLNQTYDKWRYLQIIKNTKDDTIKTIFLDCEFFKD